LVQIKENGRDHRPVWSSATRTEGYARSTYLAGGAKPS